jgi:hypothetical protein
MEVLIISKLYLRKAQVCDDKVLNFNGLCLGGPLAPGAQVERG